MESFKIGQLIITSGVNARAYEDDTFMDFVDDCFIRYKECDWGDMCEEDKNLNDLAIKCGDDRIMASYNIPNDSEKLWIITEWDHSVTTILFASEY